MRLSAVLLLLIAAQDPGDTDEQIAKWVRALDAGDVRSRDQAVRELAKIGPPALPALERARVDSPSPEVRVRAHRVILEIRLPADVRRMIDAVVTRPRSGRGFPKRPPLTGKLKLGVAAELQGHPERRAAYEKLDAKRRNTDWFTGIEELQKAGAFWCLASGLCHPHADVQIRSAKALGALGDRRVVPFMLTVARSFAVWVGGSENATLHGIFQHELAAALNQITGITVTLHRGQDQEGLKRGIVEWRQTLFWKGAKPAARVDHLGDPLPPGALLRLGTLRPRPRPGGPAVISPDGKIIAAAISGVSLWERRTGKRVKRFDAVAHGRGHVGRVTFSPDGRKLATLAGDATFRVYDMVSKRELFRLEGISYLPFAFSSDSTQLALFRSGSIDLVDAETGLVQRSVSGDLGRVKAMCFSSDGTRLASGGMKSPVRIWDTRSGEPLLTLGAESRSARVVAFSPDDKSLAVSTPVAIRLYECRTGKVIRTIREVAVRSIAFSPRGDLMAAGGIADAVRVWDIKKGTRPSLLKGHQTTVDSIRFTADGQRILASTRPPETTIHIWDVATGKEEYRTPRGHHGRVRDIQFSHDGKRIVSAGGDTILWDASSGAFIRRFKASRSVSLAPDGKTLATGDNSGHVHLWDLGSGRELWKQGDQNQVFRLSFSPDGKTLASSGFDKTIRLWQADTGKEILKITAADLLGVAWSPDGKMLASGSRGHALDFWDSSSGEKTLTLEGDNRGRFSVAFSPDGKRVAATAGNSIEVWDLPGRRRLLLIRGLDLGRGYARRMSVENIPTLRSVKYSPDGKWVAAVTVYGTVHLWNAETGAEIYMFEGHDGPLSCVAFSPNGKRLASGGRDATVLVWDLSEIGRDK